MSAKSHLRTLAAAAILLMAVSLTGCKPNNIFFDVTNGSGGTLHNVKITYPGDELNFATLDNSTSTGTFRHFDGPGDLSISYSTEDGRSHSFSGPHVDGSEKGTVKIDIQGSYASFDTKFDGGQ